MTLPLLSLATLHLLYLQNPLPTTPTNNLSQHLLSGRPKIIAHRGGSLEGKENSLSAIKKAIALKVDGVHIDPRKTKNGKFILAANENLQRITGQNKNVAELNYPEEINDIMSIIESEFNVYFEDLSGFKEKPPLLETVLEELVNTDILISVADYGKRQDTMEILEMIQQKGLLDRLILHTDLDERELRHEFGRSFLITRSINNTMNYLEAFFTGRFAKKRRTIDTDIFQTTFSFKTISDSAVFYSEDSLGTFNKEDYNFQKFFNFANQHVSELKLMNTVLNKNQKPVAYFLVNQFEDFKKAVTLGADLIFTDKPAEMSVWMMALGNHPYRPTFHSNSVRK